MTDLPLSELTAISAVDGRYRNKTSPLAPYVSEYALIKYRTEVEIRWLQQLAGDAQLEETGFLTESASLFLDQLVANFDLADAQRVKSIENTTNHDVKAVEYFIKEKLADREDLQSQLEFVHFACTSEDINNLAYALMLKNCREQVLTTGNGGSCCQAFCHGHAVFRSTHAIENTWTNSLADNGR